VRSLRGLVWLAVLLVALLLVASRCVPHPVGSARTFDAYVGKAVTTSEGVRSDVATVSLVAREAIESRVFAAYVGTVSSESEEAIGSRQSTFGSIQPPDEEADTVGEELGGLLGEALADVRDTRIAARRGDTAALPELVTRLDGDRHRLEDFEAAHR
jgi:hypothetical protein